jgi:hypothetical protein
VINEIRTEGQAAVNAITHATPTRDTAGFRRLRNDMYCYSALANFYAAKAEAALHVLRYSYSNDIADLQKALAPLQTSVDQFRALTRIAAPAYRYANSMQTAQRKIPIRGANGRYITWQELLPLYVDELQHFKTHLDSLKTATGTPAPAPQPLEPANVQGTWDTYALDSGAHPFADSNATIREVTPVLKNGKGIRQITTLQHTQGTRITFTSTEPVELLIGFFNKKSSAFTPPPQLETDASANDYGQAEPRITNALVIAGMPPVNIHAWSFPAGTHTLELGKGICLVLGFVKPPAKTKPFDAGLNEPGKKNLDWLFE